MKSYQISLLCAFGGGLAGLTIDMRHGYNLLLSIIGFLCVYFGGLNRGIFISKK